MTTSRLGRDVFRGNVQSDWIDINGHMNVAYFSLAFDLGVDALWQEFGLTEAHIKERRTSTFAVESHLTYQRELREKEAFIVTAQVLAIDAKRIHQFQRLYRASDGQLAATAEWLNLHVDLETRRVAPWPGDILERIEAFARAQSVVEPDPAIGRAIRVANPLWSARDAS